MQLFDAVDDDVGSARALDVGSHRVEEIRQVDDFRLAGGVADGRRALSAHGRHREVFRRADAGEIEKDLCALDPIGSRSLDVAVVHLELDAERLEARDVHVELSRADLATTGHRDVRAAEARDERTENGNRRAHLGDERIGRLVRVDAARVDEDGLVGEPALRAAGDLGPQSGEDLFHDLDVGDHGDVVYPSLPDCHDACGHELEHGVLCAADLHGARNGLAAVDDDYIMGIHITLSLALGKEFSMETWAKFEDAVMDMNP